MLDRSEPRLHRRVPSPRGGFLGIRASIGRSGMWFGVRAHDYDNEEEALVAKALAWVATQ